MNRNVSVTLTVLLRRIRGVQNSVRSLARMIQYFAVYRGHLGLADLGAMRGNAHNQTKDNASLSRQNASQVAAW